MSEYNRHVINDNDMEIIIVDVKDWFTYHYNSQEGIKEKNKWYSGVFDKL